jgi:beta-glucanase (GH16 family)
MWSAFWLQTPDMGSFIGDPARAGVEMDIVEHNLFTDLALPDVWHGALHWDGYGVDHRILDQAVYVPGIGDGFHTYALEWTPDALRFYFDDDLVWDASAGPISRRPEFLILSSEVEDLFGVLGPDGYGTRAESEARMVVDWVRVYAAVPEPAIAGPLIAALLGSAALRRRGGRPHRGRMGE